jgi:hypothetical protein
VKPTMVAAAASTSGGATTALTAGVDRRKGGATHWSRGDDVQRERRGGHDSGHFKGAWRRGEKKGGGGARRHATVRGGAKRVGRGSGQRPNLAAAEAGVVERCGRKGSGGREGADRWGPEAQCGAV